MQLFSARANRPVDLPDVVIAHGLGMAASRKDHDLGKSGDVEAALRYAESVMNDEFFYGVRALIGDTAPLVTPVVSIEATGRNKLPRAAAELLAVRLGLDTAEEIVQADSPMRTAMDGLSRILNSPRFSGPVMRGQDYLLLDDTVTQGGTFASLASHIAQHGGRVVGAVALTGKSYSATMKISEDILGQLREKFSAIESDFQAATGYGFDALTQSEARYLAKFKPADAVRTRILDSR